MPGGRSQVTALVVAFGLPALGGLPTQVATVGFGAPLLGSLGRGVWHIRRKEVAAHREWRVRAFAVGLAAATIRAFVGLLELCTGRTMLEDFGLGFWLGFVVNVLAAEAWIRATRRPGPAGSGSA